MRDNSADSSKTERKPKRIVTNYTKGSYLWFFMSIKTLSDELKAKCFF